MIISFTWFGNSKHAKITAIIFGIITLLLALTSMIIFTLHNNKVKTLEKTTAIVINSDATDRTKTWTEFTYICNGKEYTSKLDRIFFRVGTEKELICNSKEPKQIELYSSKSILSTILLVLAGFFGIFTLIYFLNYKSSLKKGN